MKLSIIIIICGPEAVGDVLLPAGLFTLGRRAVRGVIWAKLAVPVVAYDLNCVNNGRATFD